MTCNTGFQCLSKTSPRDFGGLIHATVLALRLNCWRQSFRHKSKSTLRRVQAGMIHYISASTSARSQNISSMTCNTAFQCLSKPSPWDFGGSITHASNIHATILAPRLNCWRQSFRHKSISTLRRVLQAGMIHSISASTSARPRNISSMTCSTGFQCLSKPSPWDFGGACMQPYLLLDCITDVNCSNTKKLPTRCRAHVQPEMTHSNSNSNCARPENEKIP